MARHHRRTFRSASRRRKVRWTESNLGGVAVLTNTEVATGWAIFPAGQYDFSFTPPAFQEEEQTLVRTMWWPYATNDATKPAEIATSTYTFAFGLIAWDAQDGNVYQNALISTTGVGSVPNPASVNNYDWLLRKKYTVTPSSADFSFINFFPEMDFDVQSRAMRKLPHGTGILICAGWDYDNAALQGNGDTALWRFNVTLAQAVKLA